MQLKDVLEIGAAILLSLGGSGAIILALSRYFGGLFAKRYEEKVRAKFQSQIDRYQTQLDVLKETALRYSNKQFELYSTLWTSLYELKILGDDLWEEATPIRLEKFAIQLKKTTIEIEKSSLFIEDEHYKELKAILTHFSNYEVGKKRLIEYRRGQGYNDNFVTEVIAGNNIQKGRYENLIESIKADLKKQLKGNDIAESRPNQ